MGVRTGIQPFREGGCRQVCKHPGKHSEDKTVFLEAKRRDAGICERKLE